MGDSARQISDLIGKILQERESVSINSSETSVSRSVQLDAAVPPSKIAMLSSGQFVGLVADEPGRPIRLKAFHAEVKKDHEAARLQEKSFQDIPAIRSITREVVDQNFRRIKQEVRELIDNEMARIKNSPEYPAIQEAAAGPRTSSSVNM